MDQQISESIEKLKSELRIIANKMIEFSFKNSIVKLEKKFVDTFESFEKKINEIENKMEKKHGEMAAKYDTKIEYIENHF